MSRSRNFLAGVLVSLIFPSFAPAQFRRVAVNPTVVRPVVGPRFYGTPAWGWGNDQGSYMQGAASVIDAQGRFLISTQEAYLKREEVRSAQLDNRRKVFEQYQYEKANSPTLEEQREYQRKQEFWRSWNDPPLTEIWSGKSLNDLLVALQMARSKQGYQGSTVPLETDLVRRINVTGGTSGTGSLGPFAQPENLRWPIPLLRMPFDKERTEIEKLAPTVVRQIATNKVDIKAFDALNDAVTRLRSRLRSQVEIMSSTDYMQALRYTNQLLESMRALQTPNAAEFFASSALTAQSVGELVDQMTQKGLRFAPATVGNEASYTALHRAMITYASAMPVESLQSLRAQFYSTGSGKR